MTLKTVGPIGAIGSVKDIPAFELPDNALSQATNVHATAGVLSRIRGNANVGPTGSVDPHYLLPYQTPTTKYVLQAGLAKLYSNDFTTLTNITRGSGDYAGTADDRWTGGVLHGIAVLANGVDKPQYWAGTGLANDLPNWPAGWVPSVIRPYRNYLVALATTKTGTAYPYLVNWSNVADPGAVPDSWDISDATKDAGEFPLSETSGAIVDGMALGERFYIYKEDALYEMQYIGGQNIFAFKKLSDSPGVFARNCVANTPVGQIALTAGDVVLNSGQGDPRSLVSNRMRSWLFRNLDSTNRKRCFVTTSPKRKEALICFPSLGQSTCDLALVWNWEADTLVEREIGGIRHAAVGVIPSSASQTWAATSGTWQDQDYAWNQVDYGPTDPRLVLSGLTLQVADQGLTFNGSAISTRVERTGLVFGDPDRVKVVRMLRPLVDAKAGTVLSIRLGYSMGPADAVSWGAAQTFTVGSSDAVYAFASGRYLAYRIESTDNSPWSLRSMTFDLVAQGRF